MRLFDGVTPLGTAPLSGGLATLIQNGTRACTRSITAESLGDKHFLGSLSAPVEHLNYVPTVGVAPFASTLAFAPLRNPALDGRLLVRFALPSSSTAARLEMVDARGRIVTRRGIEGAGTVDLAAGRTLAPGV